MSWRCFDILLPGQSSYDASAIPVPAVHRTSDDMKPHRLQCTEVCKPKSTRTRRLGKALLRPPIKGAAAWSLVVHTLLCVGCRCSTCIRRCALLHLRIGVSRLSSTPAAPLLLPALLPAASMIGLSPGALTCRHSAAPRSNRHRPHVHVCRLGMWPRGVRQWMQPDGTLTPASAADDDDGVHHRRHAAQPMDQDPSTALMTLSITRSSPSGIGSTLPAPFRDSNQRSALAGAPLSDLLLQPRMERRLRTDKEEKHEPAITETKAAAASQTHFLDDSDPALSVSNLSCVVLTCSLLNLIRISASCIPDPPSANGHSTVRHSSGWSGLQRQQQTSRLERRSGN